MRLDNILSLIMEFGSFYQWEEKVGSLLSGGNDFSTFIRSHYR